MPRLKSRFLIPLTLLLLQATPAFADAPKLDRGDTAWMLTSTALVLMMTIPGLALFYAGMVRKANLLATMAQSFGVTCLVSVLWMIVGYTIAFTPGGNFIGDFSRFMLNGMAIDSANPLAPTIPESVYMCFQMTFAIITPALMTGAIADRVKFSAIMVFCGLWLLFVYAPIAHMVWGGGFLGGLGVLDYAGGTVVHINAGVAGLVACLVVGPRNGYGRTAFPPNNIGFSLIGASLLWVGWFGFNAGSAVAADTRAGMAMATTQIATAAAALSWMSVEWALRKHPSVLGIISGAVAGLVAITPASGFVNPTGALIIGLVAGAVCFFAATTLKNRLGYDDSLDAFGVHAIGGIVGAMLTGVFATKAIVGGDAALGWIDGHPGQVLTQFYGVGLTIVYDAVVSFVLLKIVDGLIGLRVPDDTERDGLDVALHGESVA
ncbi:MAG: ammonium transporter, Amt family [Rhodospirillaceae bacterium]|nr:ammonium transporter, Amt family [Rhodospirillaceae bacterium]